MVATAVTARPLLVRSVVVAVVEGVPTPLIRLVVMAVSLAAVVVAAVLRQVAVSKAVTEGMVAGGWPSSFAKHQPHLPGSLRAFTCKPSNLSPPLSVMCGLTLLSPPL